VAIKTNPVMKQRFYLAILFTIIINTVAIPQNIKRIDGSVISTESLQAKVENLMKAANVSGVAISVFNNNKPVLVCSITSN